MAMAGLGKLAGILALGLAGLAWAPAYAQTAPKALVASQPAQRMTPKLATIHTKNETTGTAKMTNSWVCASGMRLEIYPVSFDDPTAAQQFVVVYKQDGGVVASERIDARTAKQFPAYGCNDGDMRDRSELLG
jgi:hypothetical protein